MAIYLIRHTTPQVEPGVCYGQSDLDVTDTFQAEAEQVIAELVRVRGESEREVVYFSSPLQRCHKLAKALTLDDIQIDQRLMEMNFGDWELQPWNDIDEKKLRHWTDDFVNVCCPGPGGESYQILYERVVSCIQEIQSLVCDANKDVVIVTHGGVIRSLLCYTGETTQETSFAVTVNYGGIFKLTDDGGR